MKQRILDDEPAHEAGAPPGKRISSARCSETEGGAGGALAAEAEAAAGADADAAAEDDAVITRGAGALEADTAGSFAGEHAVRSPNTTTSPRKPTSSLYLAIGCHATASWAPCRAAW